MNNFSDYVKYVNNCDKGDPLLSMTPLGMRLSAIPLNKVSNKSHLLDIVQALNIEQLIPTDSGIARDYRGLAELMGFNQSEIETYFKRSPNPIESLIDRVGGHAAAHNNRLKAQQQTSFVSLNELLKSIEQIERFDVIDDLIPFLVSLANGTVAVEEGENKLKFQAHRATQAPKIFIQNESPRLTSSLDRLTFDDTDQYKILYDAFVCYAPQDISYAQELTSLLKGANLATADDLLPGHFEHDALIRLIGERCKKVIIILTPNFISSKECDFQTKFANEIGIRARYPKIIPVLFENVDEGSLPSMVQVLSKINMTDRNPPLWNMSVTKLLRSLELDAPNEYPFNRHNDRANHSPTQQDSSEPNVELLHSQSSTNGTWLALEGLPRTPSPGPSRGIASKVSGQLSKGIKSLRRIMGDSTGTTSNMMLIDGDKSDQTNGSN